ncbi:epoxide hydrolase family protein [Undibacterium pigrum]|uniref:Microsomal epoxide hydrolase n=1 Tax=Undibacterium pigrum TaxID=401470 RepID=A0A318J1J8_9BURK|nr:epoxide hydrolase family protein [Undibacterium pigrum]PXX37818.1 microsomal epoxide hydrolase [Undibacterium pigrum]
MKITPWHAPLDVSHANDLLQRLSNARWADAIVDDWSYGTATQPLRHLIDFWQTRYDINEAISRLNALPHYQAEIDGFHIHFLYFKGRSKSKKPQPLLLSNGWPSSFVEYTRLAPMLADPGSHGGNDADVDIDDAFDVIIPAHPGFGLSARPSMPKQVQTIDLFHRLMHEGLGYSSYMVSGTDVGAGVATRMALKYPQAIKGIHLSAVVEPPGIASATDLSKAELAYMESVKQWSDKEGAYLHLQATRPQTLAYALNDSPLGLASWILEKFKNWSDVGDNLFEVFPEQMLLDNLLLYWVTQTIGSSMRYYYEARHFRPALQLHDRVSVPTAVCMWPRELVVAPKEWAARFYNLVQYTSPARGGHFPAWEQTQAYAEDLRQFSRALR